jgi:dienelactone hydrolase
MQAHALTAIICLLCVGMSATGRAAEAPDLFAPYIGQAAPEITQEIARETTDAIEVRSFRFLSRTLPDGSRVEIYALMASPVADGKYPAILVCHGGGASADQLRPSIEDWARHGYVAMCFDEPGIGGRGMKSTGPWDENKWGVWTFRPGLTDNRLYDGIVAGLNAFALLRAQDKVDRGSIGVTGGSWGGYLTTVLCGLLGDQVKAAFAVYGGGFFDEGTVFQENLSDLPEKERQRWLETLDASIYAKDIKAAFFGAYAANDWFFWPPSVMKTFNTITARKQLVFSPNTSHILNFMGGNVGATPINQFVHRAVQEIDWMDLYLKGEGQPFPECHMAGTPARRGDAVEVSFQVESPTPIITAQVWYAYGDTPWRTRYWQEAVVEKDRNVYRAHIPVEEVDQPIDWFALVSDSRNISTSTPMARLIPSAYGFRASDGEPSYFQENFEFVKVGRRWSPDFPGGEARKKCAYAFSEEAAHDGRKGLQITGPMAIDCHGIRGSSLSDPSVLGIRFWVKSTGTTGFDIELADEGPDARYQIWENHQDNPGPKWTQVTLRWKDFSPTGGTHGPYTPKQALAKLRIVVPEGGELSFDTFETVTE